MLSVPIYATCCMAMCLSVSVMPFTSAKTAAEIDMLLSSGGEHYITWGDFGN